MSFSYQPRTESEIAAMSLLPEGDYPFMITKTSDAPSKKTGKPMLTLSLLCYMTDGRSREVIDYIVPGTAYADKKLFELCKATGLLAKYQSQSLQALDFEGKEGWAKISIEKGQKKENSDQYFADKNKVGWYLKGAPEGKTGAVPPVRREPTERELANLPPVGTPEADDSAPF